MTWEPSDAWRDSYDSWKLASPPEYEGEDPIDEDDPTECCPGCNVEWADQYRGECSICNSTGRVRKLECPSESEIDRSQAAIGAVLGPNADDEVEF